MQTLGVIPARGGSKGLPRKNILKVNGKPLIAWTIKSALRAKNIDRLILSSDDNEIMTIAEAYGCEVPFRRDAEISSDTATSMDVVLDALKRFPSYDHVALLQPTSPLRNELDIDAAFELLEKSHAPSCVSVSLAEESPYWMYRVTPDNRMTNIVTPPVGQYRRQDLPPIYSLNGAIYIAKTDWLIKNKSFLSPETVAYIMPKDRSLDIDTEDDFLIFKNHIDNNEIKLQLPIKI